MVTMETILKVLADLFKSNNIIDPHLSDTGEIEKLKIKELEYFQHNPVNDPTIKLEDLFQDMIDKLQPLFPSDQPPTTSPNDYTVFNEVETIGDLADNILGNT